MPRGSSSAVHAATVLFLAGLAIAIVGFFQIERSTLFGLALVAAGFAVVVVGSLVSRRAPASGGHDRPSRGA
jgi:hypothetical protein